MISPGNSRREQPEDFRKLCADVDGMAGMRGKRLRHLSSYDLNLNGLDRLARSVNAAAKAGCAAPLDMVKLAVISNATTDLWIGPLIASGARYGLALDIVAAPFGVTMQAALDPDSSIRSHKPDFVLFGLDYRAFFVDYALTEDASAAVETALGQLSAMIEALRPDGSTIIVQTLAAPPERLFGSLDRRQPGTVAWCVEQFNERLCRELIGPSVLLFDVEALAADVGLSQWYDRANWLSARLSFAHRAIPAYAEHCARLLGAARGKSRRVLVLDLDNTLWGGVVGDDGISGLQLAQGDSVGEAFLDLQRAALALKKRGILLAICSKNTEAVARAALAEHPDMLLRESDFAAVQINWTDKATNLEAISAKLSLGLDTFVFLDDNPAEREQVRTALPDVCVLEVPEDPGAYARILMTAGLFESVTFSEEDRNRSDQYAANASRDQLMADSRDLTSFLRSLEMSISFSKSDASGWQRFTQLINKSNQFNLTTRRYSDAQIQSLILDPSVLLLQVRLVDRFGDNGMISAIIGRNLASEFVIDTWVMSCRVLNRQVEQAVLNEIVRLCAATGVSTIRGVYRPTSRNVIVADHYLNLGFSKLQEPESSEDDARSSEWVLDVASYVPKQVPIATRPESAA
jgi:FkbH-like protein